MSKICNNAFNFFKVTNSGIDIFDINDLDNIVYTKYVDVPVNCITCNDFSLYYGTNSGLFVSEGSSHYNLDYKFTYELSDAFIVDADCNNNYLCVVTHSGVDKYDFSTYNREYKAVDGVLTVISDIDFYWYNTSHEIYGVYGNEIKNINVDYYINSFSINKDFVCVATVSGAFIYDKNNTEYIAGYFGKDF